MGMPHIPILTLLFLLTPLCRSDDRLTHAKPLSAGDTLISEGGVFALGFFSPTSSNTTMYLCMWYHNISERTVVWTANRNNPLIATSSPILTFTNSSDLLLSDSQGRTPWAVKSNITGMGVAAVLLDTGNFVLQFPNSTVIWQSFDHPTDTVLPNMKVLLSVGRLLAWKGLDDPSSGDFSLGFNASSNLQLVIWNGTRPYSRVLLMNGGSVFGDTFQNITFFESIGDTGNGSFYTYHLSDGSPYARVTLDYMGVLSTLIWNRSSWTTISKRPASSCDLYASCGPFGYCNHVGDVPTCQCLEGFEPVGPGMNSSAGCRRTEALTCTKKSRFVNITQMNIPNKFESLPNKSIDECASKCSSNCLCTAYAYAKSSSNDALVDRSSCLVWAGELINTGKNSYYGEILHLRLADFPVKENTRLIKIVLPVIACVLILTCIAIVTICKYKASKRQKKEIHKRLILGYLNSSNEIEGENVEFPFVSFEDIITATDNFSDSKHIGRGGFGKVYRGMLEGVKEVAIKRLSKDSGQGVEEFKNEIVLISKLQHKNLVRLLGCCIHGDERLLIYEYLPNKSLDTFLFDPTRQCVLDWPTRFKIIKGVARGLLYLHQDSRLTIIHRDLKASNILLDSEMTPKISDFGMARIFGGNQQEGNTTRVVGT
ncbi:G-type lectin S-receptor-like serine/threonine-protein kinase B120 [Lolium rigidum]|uniref:G-type lectin S-receptor-like serine/threonine-protein kinase B120 n=1 Tax=Lolium rigidum TaxID=89674 RepID=UPI001F5DAEB3|nr:G-type lectin S-receptor-like serine/threonine-protein kinase B120 [Lolium rigidum]